MLSSIPFLVWKDIVCPSCGGQFGFCDGITAALHADTDCVKILS
jgi:hypothetical protein